MAYLLSFFILLYFFIPNGKGLNCPNRQWIEESLNKSFIPGAAVVVVNATHVIYEEAFGYHSLIPSHFIDMDKSIFTLASISKTLIAVAVMQLVEQKRVDLDMDINQYLSESGYRIFHPQYPSHSITLRQLLSHSASIAVNENTQISLYKTGDTAFEQSTLTDTLFTLLNSNTSNWLPEAPGSVSFYSNEGSSLAALVVEKVTNISFDQYVKDRILKPLNIDVSQVGVRLADFQNREELVKHYAYAPNTSNLNDWLEIMPQLNIIPLLDSFPTWLYIPFFGFSAYPAGLFRMSASSLSKFLRMFINKGFPILSARSILEIKTIVGAGLIPDYIQNTSNDAEGIPSLFFGLSWYWATLSDGRRYIGHSGSLPGSRHLMLVNEKSTLGVIVLSNGDSNGPGNRTFEVYKTLENIHLRLFECFETLI
ncbi:unnamed protein product [Rotaria sp. Silwood2]|nr:unnamed protein product [Rotaria sp. Silwood2]